jgi:Phage integrase, N-terminal SAM-like domain
MMPVNQNEIQQAELETFLTHLAVQEQVTASTQNQALSAILFLYREVLKQDLGISVRSMKESRYNH